MATDTSPRVHIKCGVPIEFDPTRRELAHDFYTGGAVAFGFGLLLLLFGGGILGVALIALAVIVWLMAATRVGLPDHDRRCRSCGVSWRSDADWKHTQVAR